MFVVLVTSVMGIEIIIRNLYTSYYNIRKDDDYLLQFVRRDYRNTVMNFYDALEMCGTPISTGHAPNVFHEHRGFHLHLIDSYGMNQVNPTMNYSQVLSITFTPTK